jgi:hypothetical protein
MSLLAAVLWIVATVLYHIVDWWKVNQPVAFARSEAETITQVTVTGRF